MGQTNNKKDLHCPLGCPATRRFDRPEMEEHLSALHGCDEDYSMADDGKVQNTCMLTPMKMSLDFCNIIFSDWWYRLMHVAF